MVVCSQYSCLSSPFLEGGKRARAGRNYGFGGGSTELVAVFLEDGEE